MLGCRAAGKEGYVVQGLDFTGLGVVFRVWGLRFIVCGVYRFRLRVESVEVEG